MTSINETPADDVIIIGCGPSGIAAAIDLKKDEKIKVRILEARDRVGGRVFTDSTTFGVKHPVDLGAQWLHHYRPENPLYSYERDSDPEKKNHRFTPYPSTIPFFLPDGKRIPLEQVLHAEKIFEQICEKMQHHSSIEDQSVHEFVENEMKNYQLDSLIEQLVKTIFGKIEQYEGSNLNELSAKSYMQSDGCIEEYNQAMPDGFGTLITKIVKQHQLSVELNCNVVRVDASSGSTVRICTEDGRVFDCKYLLITIPLGCLKKNTIEFIPELPLWKQEAINRMGFGTANKVFIEFPFAFWDTNEESVFTTSSKFRFMHFQKNMPIILLKLSARVAIELETKTDKEVVDEVVGLLKNIYADREVPEPTRFVMTRWNQDRFSHGSYSNFNVGANNETLKELARECHGRLYWAGEHTNYDGSIGCVDSAFESGQREAKRISKQLHAENSQ